MGIAAISTWYKVNPVFGMYAEGYLFRHAAAMLEGYANGSWHTGKLGDTGFAYAYPDVKLDATKRVTLVSDISGAEAHTDIRSAGAALTILAVAHAVETIIGKFPNASIGDDLIRFSDKLKDSIRDDKTLDQTAIYRITD